MDTKVSDLAQQVRRQLRTELLRLATLEERVAADEAATVHYWEPLPAAVSGHRNCAVALRRAAHALDLSDTGPRVAS